MTVAEVMQSTLSYAGTIQPVGIFADNEAINKWLGENPLILGAGAIAISLVLLGLGASALLTGKATTKRGHKLEGNNAKAMGAVWAGFGGLLFLFGLYKIAIGLFGG